MAENCPNISDAELTAKIDLEVGHEEFLFFRRTEGDHELDWILGEAPDGYEMHCTACGNDFFEKRDKKNPASKMMHCPRCNAGVTARRWRDRAGLEKLQFAYHLFQRGEGAGVWFRSFQVRGKRDFESGEKYDLFEYARVLFQAGGARRWTRLRSYCYGETNWEEKKSVKLKRWHGEYGNARADVWGGVETEEIAGSCVQYSQMGEAIEALADPIGYLGLYVKYPVCEYLWKMGLGHFFRERENGAGNVFWQVVNPRARKPDELLRGMNRQETRLVTQADGRYGLRDVLCYRKLRDAGACRADRESFEFAAAVRKSGVEAGGLTERLGVTALTLRRYWERQAARSGARCENVIRDHRDYLEQLARLGAADGDTLPQDLRAAHERLSERERRAKNGQKNASFRQRRHLLRWMCWRHDGMLIRPVDSMDEITREGEMQRNCVAGYAERHAAGKTIILMLRRTDEPGKSWHTVEVNPKTLTVTQCRGYRNAEQSPEAARFITAWLAHLEQVRPVIKKKRRRAA